jgi:hypothetical protein
VGSTGGRVEPCERFALAISFKCDPGLFKGTIGVDFPYPPGGLDANAVFVGDELDEEIEIFNPKSPYGALPTEDWLPLGASEAGGGCERRAEQAAGADHFLPPWSA